MKSENHQDIIKEMADRLREHAVPYQEGAWERFKDVEQKKSRRLVLWPYLSAAILIAVILFLKPEQNKPIVNELVEHKVDENVSSKENIIKETIEKRIEDSQVKATSRKDRTVLVSKTETNNQTVKEAEVIFQPSEKIIENEQIATTYVGERKKANDAITIDVETSSAHPITMIEVRKPVDFLTGLLDIEKNEALVGNQEIDKKWSVGLNVSPNVSGNSHINMGGGVAFAYAVSSKISFSSGVSYLQLDAERIPHAPSQMSFPNSSNAALSPKAGVYLESNSRTKTLNKTKANLIGLDIPITINYHVSEKLFASAGVSVFNVINEERMNQYENQVIDVFYSGLENKTPEPMVRTFYSKEVANEKLYEGKSLNGFFNFSVGYSIPVSKKVGLSIEPFLKIPMSSVGEQDMNLRNGGIKIGTRF